MKEQTQIGVGAVVEHRLVEVVEVVSGVQATVAEQPSERDRSGDPVSAGDGLPGAGIVARDLLDPEAPMLRLQGRAEPGDVAVARLRRDQPSRGALGAVLGQAGTARAALYRLAAARGLSPVFPEAAWAEAQAFAAAPGLDDSGLEDLEHLPFVTIDNQSSRDLDQALYIESREPGWVIWYALADASYPVQPGSALFDEALRRGSSYYLPGLAIPMLPRLLSEDLVSLNQGCTRRALVLEMQLDRHAACLETRIRRARVRSRRKLSFGLVQRAWDDPSGAGAAFRGQPFEQSLGLLREVGARLIDEARRRHVVRYHRSEVEVVPGDDGSGGTGLEVELRERLEVEACNEQISLLANIQGARMLEAGRGLAFVQPVFRVHPAPGPERLDRLEAMIAALVREHGLDPRQWAWRGAAEPLADYLERLPRRARPRIAEAIDRQAVITNRRSMFAEHPGLHHGIGAPVYARFSSPMREVVGIFTHKEALELLGGGETAPPSREDEALRDLVVEAGNRSKSLQRTLTKDVDALVLERLLRGELARDEDARPWRRATLLGMKPDLLYVRLDDPPLEVKVHLDSLEHLTGIRWQPDELGVVARPPRDSDRPSLRVGDAVQLRLAGWEDARHRWLFAINRL